MSFTLDRTEPVIKTGRWNVTLVPAGRRFRVSPHTVLPPEREPTVHFFIAEYAGRDGFHELGQHWGWMELAAVVDRSHRGAAGAWVPYGGSMHLVVTGEDLVNVREWAMGNHAVGGLGRKQTMLHETEVHFVDYGTRRRFNALLAAHLARYDALLACGVNEDPGAAFAAFSNDVSDAQASPRGIDAVSDAHWDAAAKLFIEAAER